MNLHTPDEAEDFCDGLIEAVLKDATAKIDEMDAEECIAFTRDFVKLMAEWQPEAIDPEDATMSAAGSMLLAVMFPIAFSKAYKFTNNYLNAKASLYKVMEKNGNL